MTEFNSDRVDTFQIGDRTLGEGTPVFIVAEMSANHGQDFDVARRIIDAAADAGADAIKVQTYTPDTLTVNCDREYFQIETGTEWDGRTLYDLYEEAYMPWEWHEDLQAQAHDLGLEFFSTAFDESAVELLEKLNVPVHKTASFEIVHLPLIKKMATTGKPLIMSTGMSTFVEIKEAVETAWKVGATEILLLKCTSAYPASLEDMNLKAINTLSEKLELPVGLSDHTLGSVVPEASAALGAVMIEKHFTLSRELETPDSSFSMEPAEFKAMVESVREVEKTLGTGILEVSGNEEGSRVFRRSLFIVEDLKEGQILTEDNVRIIRPGYGMHPRHYGRILGKQVTEDVERGTPLSRDLFR